MHVMILSKYLSLFLILSLENSLMVREALKLLLNYGFMWPLKGTVHKPLIGSCGHT